MERILIVEDEPLVRMVLAEHLRDHAYEVLEAGDASEAVHLLKSSSVKFNLAAQSYDEPSSDFTVSADHRLALGGWYPSASRS